jgi:predicted transcriptional regulator
MTADQIALAINRNEQTVYKHLRGEVKTLRVNAAVKKKPKKPMELIRSYVMPDKEFFDERDFPEYF